MTFLSGLRTHITAIVGLLVAALVGFGIITPEGEAEATEAIINTFEIGFGLVLAIQSLIAIFQRLATKKVETKADVAASAVKTAKTAGRLPVSLIVCGFGVAMLTGCGVTKGVSDIITNPDGKPIVTGEVCVNTPNGRFCYIPEKPVIVEPETVPATATVVAPVPPTPTPPPIMPAARSYTPLTVAPQLAK